MLHADQALDWGFTGVMLRGSGFIGIYEKHQPYEIYDQLNFEIPVGNKWRLL